MTIPYWDWGRVDDAGGRYPVAFARPGLSDAERFTDGDALEPNTLSITVNTPDWNQFGGYPSGSAAGDYGDFEFGPHNFTHGAYIGGKMGDPVTAADDPIYWSFHCFIDLLWDEWQRRNQGTPPTSPNAELRGFPDQLLRKVSDFQDVAALSYDYELTVALKAALKAAEKTPADGVLFGRKALAALFSNSMPQQLDAESRAAFVLPSAEPARRVLVKLEKLRIPTVGSYTLRAYVHPRAIRLGELATVDLRAFEAGYISLWKAHTGQGHGGHHGPAHHPTSAIVRLDVTEAVARMAAANEPDLLLTFSFAPARRPSGGPPPRAELLAEMSLRDVVIEEYR